jgi:peptide/nickel transport system ATP-binding protein
MIFQEPAAALNPVFTVGRQTMEIVSAHEKLSASEAYDRIVGLYTEMGLKNPEKIFDSYPHQLSGGQKQRAMIAMAVACRPSLLLADEPTTALDATVQQKVLQLLIELQRSRGLSIVFISHDLALVKQIAHRVVVLHRGRIVESGLSDDVLVCPKHPYTRALLACRPRLGFYPKRLPTVGESPHASESNFTVSTVSSIPLISVKDLKVEYKTNSGLKFTAVNHVTFEIFKGETLGLAGESGSGKSTIGKALLKLVAAVGSVRLHNAAGSTELLSLSEGAFRPHRRNLQIIFQDPYGSLNPKMTVGQTLVEPMKVHGLYDNDKARLQKAAELLEKVGMTGDFLKRLPNALSGGQRQRVAIARALTLNPKFIVCDECVSALDVSVQAAVLNLLNDLKDEFGLSYLFISHDVAVLRYMCDRIMVMRSGEIVETGAAEEIVAHPKHPYTQTLVAAAPKD